MILESDVIIFDYEESELDEVLFAAKILKYSNFDD